MATVNLNLNDDTKKKFDFLVEVQKKIFNRDASKTSILKILLNKFFEENQKYINLFEKYGEIQALQKIQSNIEKPSRKVNQKKSKESKQNIWFFSENQI